MPKTSLTPNRALTAWLRIASPEQKKALAKAAKTSVEVLQHYAKGRRHFSAEFAQRLAHASDGNIHQTALCDACRRCPIRK
jgi:hypothetical protein